MLRNTLLILLAAIVGIPSFCLLIDSIEFHSAHFDQKAWAIRETPSTRVRMAGDLVHKLKDGKPDRDRVSEMLGKPAYGEEGDSEWGYRLGRTTFGLHDLIIRFDPNGHVRDVLLWRL